MTIVVKSTKAITAWVDTGGNFSIDGIIYARDEAIKLRDYLVEKLKD